MILFLDCGFHIDVSTDDKNVSNGSGRIYSPGYPGVYESNLVCLWTLTAEEGYRVQLNFSNFDIEDPTSIGKCFDYIEVRVEISPIDTHDDSNDVVTAKLNTLSASLYLFNLKAGTICNKPRICHFIAILIL